QTRVLGEVGAAGELRGEPRLPGQQRLGVEFGRLAAGLPLSGDLGRHLVALRRGGGDDQGTARLEIDRLGSQSRADLPPSAHRRTCQLRLRAGRATGEPQAALARAGGAPRHRPAVQHRHPQPGAGEVVGARRAHDAGTHHDRVLADRPHRRLTPPRAGARRRFPAPYPGTVTGVTTAACPPVLVAAPPCVAPPDRPSVTFPDRALPGAIRPMIAEEGGRRRGGGPVRRSTITRQELRERWETDVSPLLTAVRAGAARATEVGRREWARSHRRARMRRRARRWRLPWMAVAAALAAVGVMGGLRAARTDRSRTDPDL